MKTKECVQKDDTAEIIAKLIGADVKEMIYGEGKYQKGEVIGTLAMREAYEVGKNVQIKTGRSSIINRFYYRRPY